jgi:hypothetical protein
LRNEQKAVRDPLLKITVLSGVGMINRGANDGAVRPILVVVQAAAAEAIPCAFSSSGTRAAVSVSR